MRWETGDGRQKGAGRQTRDGRRTTGDRWRESGDGRNFSTFNLAGEFYHFLKNSNRKSKI